MCGVASEDVIYKGMLHPEGLTRSGYTVARIWIELNLFCMMQGTQKEYPIVVLPFYTKKPKTRQET